MQRIEADPVAELGRMADVPNGQIGTLPGADLAAVGKAQGLSGRARCARQSLRRRQAEKRAPHVHGQKDRGHGRRAGVAVRCHRHWNAVAPKMLDGREPRFPERVERARQQDGDGARRRHRPGIVWRRVLQMIGGERAVSGRKPGAAKIRELLGVQFDRQTERLGRLENTFDLIDPKGNARAKSIDRVGKVQAGGRFQRRDTHRVDVSVRIVPVFRRNGMGAEKAGSDIDAARFAETPRDPQHAQLGIPVQPVAGLDFDRRHPFGDQVFQAPRGRSNELFFRSPPGGADRGCNAAALARDLFVADTVQALLELLRPIAAKDDVRMAIDKTGRDDAIAEMNPVRCGIAPGKVRRCADPRDLLAIDDNGPLTDKP